MRVRRLRKRVAELEVVIRPDALDIGDRIGGLIQRIPAKSATEHDLAALSTLMQMIKGKFPETTTATVLAQPDTPYDMLVQVMDAVREARPEPATPLPKGAARPVMALFPDISIGDAPISVAKK